MCSLSQLVVFASASLGAISSRGLCFPALERPDHSTEHCSVEASVKSYENAADHRMSRNNKTYTNTTNSGDNDVPYGLRAYSIAHEKTAIDDQYTNESLQSLKGSCLHALADMISMGPLPAFAGALIPASTFVSGTYGARALL